MTVSCSIMSISSVGGQGGWWPYMFLLNIEKVCKVCPSFLGNTPSSLIKPVTTLRIVLQYQCVQSVLLSLPLSNYSSMRDEIN